MCVKINKVETIRSIERNYCWILIYTDEGHVGLGETYHRADPAELIVHEFARDILLGQDPRNIERILNPDLAWTGGLSEVRKIAACAQVHYVPVAPHNYGSLSCMALTHLMAALPNTRHLEFTAYRYPIWNSYLDEPITWPEGQLALPRTVIEE